MARECDELQAEYATLENRMATIRRRLNAFSVLLEDEPGLSSPTHQRLPAPSAIVDSSPQREMPYDDGRSLVDLIKSVVATFALDREFTSQDVLVELNKLRPSITQTSQFGPGMMRLVQENLIAMTKERRGRMPAKYTRLK